MEGSCLRFTFLKNCLGLVNLPEFTNSAQETVFQRALYLYNYLQIQLGFKKMTFSERRDDLTEKRACSSAPVSALMREF